MKRTNTGDCLNYDSIGPDRYKIDTIKIMLHRAYKIYSERTSFYREVNQLKQLFTDNNYLMKIADTVINRVISRNLDDATVNSTELPKENIRLYYRSQMNSNYKKEERNLKSIIETNLSHFDETRNIQTLIYYENRKVGYLFLKNSPHKKTVCHAVHQYTCAKEGCQPNQSYIGYTTTPVKQRMTTHAQNGAIKNHNLNENNSRISNIFDQIQILFSATDKIRPIYKSAKPY